MNIPELEDDDHLYASIEDINVTESLIRSEPFQPQQGTVGQFCSTVSPTTAPESQAGTSDNNSYASISPQGWAINWPGEIATGNNHSSGDHEQSWWGSFEVSRVGQLKSLPYFLHIITHWGMNE